MENANPIDDSHDPADRAARLQRAAVLRVAEDSDAGAGTREEDSAVGALAAEIRGLRRDLRAVRGLLLLMLLLATIVAAAAAPFGLFMWIALSR